MTTQSFPISDVGCDPTRNPDMDDDLSIATPPIGYRNSNIDHEFVSKTVRFYFAPSDRTRLDSIAPADVHIQWMRCISSAFGDDVKIINNHNKPVLGIDASVTAANGTLYKNQFQLHQKPMGFTPSGTTKTAVIIIHAVSNIN